MKLAIVGATGLVGQEMLLVLEERNFEIDTLVPVASERSVGKLITYRGKDFPVVSMTDAIDMKPDYALFSAGGSVSLEFAPRFAEVGTVVIDNSSAWRMDPTKRLVVPEINGAVLTEEDKIIANPNCSTIQMVLALAPLHEAYQIKRIVVSTYQSVTGTGKAAVDQLADEMAHGTSDRMVYPHPIHKNVLPQVDIFLENDYTKEEMKMVNETKKIFGDDSVQITATCVRLPVEGGHAESVNIEFVNDFEVEEVRRLIAEMPGCVVEDDPSSNNYPMPLTAHGRDEVFVGRIRRDDTQPNTLNLWIVADNLRKGAATNTVQIAEYLEDQKQLA